MTQPDRAARRGRAGTRSALAACLLGSLAACGSAAGGSSNPEEFKARIVYVETRPDSYSENGVWKGMSADAVHAILKKMGAAVEKEIASDTAGVIPGLAAGRYNLVGSSFFMTPERCKQVAFSNPLLLVKEAMAFRSGVTAKLSNVASLLENPDLRLGVVQGSAELKYATGAGLPSSRITQYPDVISTVEALKGNRIDVLMIDNITLTHVLSTTAGVEGIKKSEPFIPVVKGKPVDVDNALMFPRSETRVVEAFNKALAELRSSGELAKLLAPYGVTEAEVEEAGKRTAEQVCTAT